MWSGSPLTASPTDTAGQTTQKSHVGPPTYGSEKAVTENINQMSAPAYKTLRIDTNVQAERDPQSQVLHHTSQCCEIIPEDSWRRPETLLT